MDHWKDRGEPGLLRRIGFLFFPRRCLFCDEPVEPDQIACSRCEKELPWVTDPICPYCGFGMEHCTCLGGLHPLDGNRSVFYYTGLGERGLVRFKFYGRRDAAYYLAQLLKASVQRWYGSVAFDGVTCVPMYPDKEAQRGYNQSDLLAAHLAQGLKLPYDGHLLCKVKDYPAQHKLGSSERRRNVQGAFQMRHPIQEGSVWLLVDDVFTTGSTVQECAKVLKAAGAAQVFSVTLAASYRKGIIVEEKSIVKPDGCRYNDKRKGKDGLEIPSMSENGGIIP